MKCPICREELEGETECICCGWNEDMPDSEVKHIKRAIGR